jgi:hypothetical protein
MRATAVSNSYSSIRDLRYFSRRQDHFVGILIGGFVGTLNGNGSTPSVAIIA